MRSLVAITVALLSISVVPAQEPLSPKWESLFNGKDLTGWQKIGNEKDGAGEEGPRQSSRSRLREGANQEPKIANRASQILG